MSEVVPAAYQHHEGLSAFVLEFLQTFDIAYHGSFDRKVVTGGI